MSDSFTNLLKTRLINILIYGIRKACTANKKNVQSLFSIIHDTKVDFILVNLLERYKAAHTPKITHGL